MYKCVDINTLTVNQKISKFVLYARSKGLIYNDWIWLHFTVLVIFLSTKYLETNVVRSAQRRSGFSEYLHAW